MDSVLCNVIFAGEECDTAPGLHVFGNSKRKETVKIMLIKSWENKIDTVDFRKVSKSFMKLLSSVFVFMNVMISVI